ncbi:MAG: hypothetical protein ACLPXM_09800 [Terriglobales bacterium]
MDVQIRVQRWVIWWLYTGVALGVIAIGNILGRDLSREQIKIILFLGVVFWLLGGMVSYALHAVQFEHPSPPLAPAPRGAPEKEWHAASDFLLPGGRKSILPPRY